MGASINWAPYEGALLTGKGVERGARMGGKKLVIVVWVVGLILGLGVGVGLVLAEGQGAGVDIRSPAEEPVGSAFTYQGRLTDSSGVPIDDVCDFEFGLWDSLDGSTGQIGDTDTVTNVTVADGLFTVQVNEGGEFGMGAFSGVAHWLEIGVRCPAGGGSYTTLGPRQELTAAPYAHYALEAGDLVCLNCVANSHIKDGTILFADLGQNGCGAREVMKRDSGNTAWECASDDGLVYQRTVLVSPVGTATENGTALLNALAGIDDASDTNPYLLKIEPGVYDLGSSALTMKEYVDVEGSGELVTTIKGSGSGSTTTGTVVGCDNAELRFVTVKNTGGATYATAIFTANMDKPRLTHVTAIASGGTRNYGIKSDFVAEVTMTDVTVAASGGSYTYGVENVNSASAVMTNVSITASGASAQNYGVYNEIGGSARMTNVSVVAVGPGTTGTVWGVLNKSNSSTAMTNVTVDASAGWTVYGLRNEGNSTATMVNVTVASSGPGYIYGIYNDSSSTAMSDTIISASGGAYRNRGVHNASSSSTMTNVTITTSGTAGGYGIYNYASSGSYTVDVDSSRITGSLSTIRNDAEFTTQVGASLLAGGAVVAGGGTVTCAGVYDEGYTFYPSSCP